MYEIVLFKVSSLVEHAHSGKLLEQVDVTDKQMNVQLE